MPKCLNYGWFLPYKAPDNEFGAWKKYYLGCVQTPDYKPALDFQVKILGQIYCQWWIALSFYIHVVTQRNVIFFLARILGNEYNILSDAMPAIFLFKWIYWIENKSSTVQQLNKCVIGVHASPKSVPTQKEEAAQVCPGVREDVPHQQ